jgi:hypothetical protein
MSGLGGPGAGTLRIASRCITCGALCQIDAIEETAR